jgi:hypothetical protein
MRRPHKEWSVEDQYKNRDKIYQVSTTRKTVSVQATTYGGAYEVLSREFPVLNKVSVSTFKKYLSGHVKFPSKKYGVELRFKVIPKEELSAFGGKVVFYPARR